MCGFLVGFGATESTIFALTTHMNNQQATALAHQESKTLTFTFARFYKWFPDVAQTVEPYIRSRQSLYHSYITDGRRATIRSYLEPENRNVLEVLEDTLRARGCSIPFNRATAIGEMERSIRQERGDWFETSLIDLKSTMSLVGLFVLCGLGLGVVIWREAREKIRQMRYIVKVEVDMRYRTTVAKGRINDISQKGAKLFFLDGHDYPLGVGARIAWKDIRIPCRVRWSTDTVVGVEFKHPISREQLGRIRAASQSQSMKRRKRSVREARELQRQISN